MKVQDKYKPLCIDELVINNTNLKDKVMSDIASNAKMKYIINGNYDHSKTLITELIVMEYYKLNSTSVNIGEKFKYVFKYNCFQDFNWTDENNQLQIFCKNHLPFKKFIIFDNCDTITLSQQQIIKKLIDDYQEKINFIFITTDLKSLSDVIKSRCIRFDILPFKKQQIFNIMNKVCKKEMIVLDKKLFHNNIINIKNKGITYFMNIINKAILLNINEINSDNIDMLQNEISHEEFDEFLLQLFVLDLQKC